MPVVGVVRVQQQTLMLVGKHWLMDHRTHYWALRQQARYLFVPLGKPGIGFGCRPALVVGCGV